MAVLADIRRCDMVWRLAGGGASIVAAYAGAAHLRVVELHARPARRDVAIFADIRCGNMIG